MIFTTLGVHQQVKSLPLNGANIMISNGKLPLPAISHVTNGGIIGVYKTGDFPIPVDNLPEEDFPILSWQREVNASNHQFWLFIPSAEAGRKAVKLYALTWQSLGGTVYYVDDLEEDLSDIEKSLPSFDIRVDILNSMPGINEKVARALIEKWGEYDTTGREYSFSDVIWAIFSGAGYGYLENDIMAIVDSEKPEREKWLQELFLGK